MLGNKGNVNVRNVTIVNPGDFWIYKVNPPKYRKPAATVTLHETESWILLAHRADLKYKNSEKGSSVVSREHKGTSDKVSWAAVWVPDVAEGLGSFLWVDACSRGFLYRRAPEKNNFPLQPVGLQVI